MKTSRPRGVVHLELHTRELTRACAFYAALLGWRSELVRVQHASYRTLDLGGAPGGGVVECGASRPAWVPYVQVEDVFALTARAQDLGATVLLGPREGPAGWRSVVAEPGSGEVALWQPKSGLTLCGHRGMVGRNERSEDCPVGHLQRRNGLHLWGVCL